MGFCHGHVAAVARSNWLFSDLPPIRLRAAVELEADITKCGFNIRPSSALPPLRSRFLHGVAPMSHLSSVEGQPMNRRVGTSMMTPSRAWDH
jgi:hypothetical protein